jgi:hypothetical protein
MILRNEAKWMVVLIIEYLINNTIMENIIQKLATRKDIRGRMSEDEARKLFIQVRTDKTREEIEQELRKIYDSSLDVLSEEDLRGVLLFGEVSTC